ncbi:MAG: alpha/beta hydrolase [Steroidobacteraceae bacterium]|nr:alpha/beta hydrolase [Steroidobacteraceae bacterium]
MPDIPTISRRIGLVLLPGMDGTGELFDPLLDALPVRIDTTVVRYPDRAASYAEHEAIARAELPKNQPYVLLGESFSGPVAVQIAASAPANLRGLILCASFLTRPHKALEWLRPFVSFASPKLLPSFVAQRSLLGRFATEELRAAQTRALAHVSSPTLTSRLRAMADVDARAAMRAVAVPTLYLQATEDRVVDARFAGEYAQCAKHPSILKLEGPHLLLQSNAAGSAEAIERFIDKLG